MNALYKRKKTLLLIALFCINSVGSFMPTIKALPTESTSNGYAPPPLSVLPPRVAMIAKSKEKEYARMLKYYEYRVSWSSFYIVMCALLFLLGLTIYVLHGFIHKLGSSLVSANSINKDELLGSICLSICSVTLLYVLRVAFLKAKYPGAILLTDAGILYIDCGYNAQYEFIPYADIKTVQFKISQDKKFIKIEFVKNFIDYERKGIKYSDKVNSILIAEENIPTTVSDPNPFLDLYGRLSQITEQIHIAAMREKVKQESTQGKEKSLLEIKKEQAKFIDNFKDISQELHEKTATVQANHPAIFAQIEAYYPDGVLPFISFVLMELVFIAMFAFTLYDCLYSPNPLLSEFLLKLAMRVLSTLLIFFGTIIYYLYDSCMHPAGVFITDTGFLLIEAGKKLRYTFIRYEHIQELLRNVNDQTLLVSTTQSTHETPSLINSAVPQTIKIRCPRMAKKIFNTLYEHLRLKKAEVIARKSRLTT